MLLKSSETTANRLGRGLVAKWSAAGSVGDEREDRGRQVGALVLLEEVAAAGDRHVRPDGRAVHELAEPAIGTPRDRVAVAERAEERLVERPERVPGPAVVDVRRVVRRRRDEERELASALLVRLVRERRVVGRDDVRGEVRERAGVDDRADRQRRYVLGEP